MTMLMDKLALYRLNRRCRQALRLNRHEDQLVVMIERIEQVSPVPEFSFGLRGMVFRCKYYVGYYLDRMRRRLAVAYYHWIKNRLAANKKFAERFAKVHPRLLEKG